MIETIMVNENVGVIKTSREFIIIINGNIHGPFNSEHARKIYEMLGKLGETT